MNSVQSTHAFTAYGRLTLTGKNNTPDLLSCFGCLPSTQTVGFRIQQPSWPIVIPEASRSVYKRIAARQCWRKWLRHPILNQRCHHNRHGNPTPGKYGNFVGTKSNFLRRSDRPPAIRGDERVKDAIKKHQRVSHTALLCNCFAVDIF